MVSFEKDKEEQITETYKYRYEPPPVEDDEEIADVLLTESDEAPLVAALVEPDTHKDDEIIYELVVEEEKANVDAATDSLKTDSASSAATGSAVESSGTISDSAYPENEAMEAASLNAQVTRLCQEYAAINQQLEKSLTASNELAKQLEKSKKLVAASYVALGIAGFSCLLGIGSVVAGVSMERDVNDLRSSLAALTNQVTVAKEESTLKNQAFNSQVTQLNEKVDKIFASDNLDSVLQVTQELKKQVNALANKNLAIMAGQRHSTPPQPKVSLPSLKVNADAPPAADKKPQPDKPVPAVKTEDTPKKAEDAKHSAADNVEVVPLKQKIRRWRQNVSKKLKRQPKAPKHAEHVQKASKMPVPALPKLD